MSSAFPDPAFAWARSGLMALTGDPEGPPVVPAFDVIEGIDALSGRVEAVTGAIGRTVRFDARQLSERAAMMRLTRGGTVSCNGYCRLLECRDGWVAINLPRESDLELLPALIGGPLSPHHWMEVEREVKRRDVADLVEGGRLLGLAISQAVRPGAGEPARLLPGLEAAVRISRPIVIDLSALWAGPLCGHILAEAGARVIKVESLRRPDSVRDATPLFFDRLNAGKESVVLDFTIEAHRQRLRALIARADMVIGSARPRAFEQLGLVPGEMIAQNPYLVWIAITAHGWTGAARDAVGFGDDAAAAGGLLAWSDDGRPMFVGDALADPLTGLAAAAEAVAAWASGRGALVDASLAGTAAFVAGSRRLEPYERGRVYEEGGAWRIDVDGRSEIVADPAVEPPAPKARAFGADTASVLRELT